MLFASSKTCVVVPLLFCSLISGICASPMVTLVQGELQVDFLRIQSVCVIQLRFVTICCLQGTKQGNKV